MTLVKYTGLLVLLFAGGRPSPGQAWSSMPSWLVLFPDASAISMSSNMLEQSYRVTAAPAEVEAHYRKLFTAQGLPFRPKTTGDAQVIRGVVPGCNLVLQIRKEADGASVKVNCAEKAEVEAAAEEHAKGTAAQPNQARASAPKPAAAWPVWLTGCDGTALQGRSFTDRSQGAYQQAVFDTAMPITGIQGFYGKLLDSNGYRVKTTHLNPKDSTTVVEGTEDSDRPGSTSVVRIELTPLDGGVHVEVRFSRQYP